MADYDRRPRGRGGYFNNNRKRRYRGRQIRMVGCRILTTRVEDDDYDRRPQRRRYEEPLATSLRKQILSIAESVSANQLHFIYDLLIHVEARP